MTRARRSNRPASPSTSPKAKGIFLWGRVPDGIDVDDLVRQRAGRLDPARQGRAVLARARQREVAALQCGDQRRAGADPVPVRGRARRRAEVNSGGMSRLMPPATLVILLANVAVYLLGAQQLQHRLALWPLRRRTSSRGRSSPIRSCTANTCAHLLQHVRAVHVRAGRWSGRGARRNSLVYYFASVLAAAAAQLAVHRGDRIAIPDRRRLRRRVRRAARLRGDVPARAAARSTAPPDAGLAVRHAVRNRWSSCSA